MQKFQVSAFVSMVVLSLSLAVQADEPLLQRAGNSVSVALQEVIDEVEALRTKYGQAKEAATVAAQNLDNGQKLLKLKQDALAKLEKDLKAITTGVDDAEANLKKIGGEVVQAEADLAAAIATVKAANRRANIYADKTVLEKDKARLAKIAEQCAAATALKDARAAVGPTKRRLRKECEELVDNWDGLRLVQAMEQRIDAAKAEVDAAVATVGTASVKGNYSGISDVPATGLYKAMEDTKANAAMAKAELEAAEDRLLKAHDSANHGEIRDGIRELKAGVGEVKQEVTLVGSKVDKTNELLVNIDGKIVKLTESVDALTKLTDERTAKMIAALGSAPLAKDDADTVAAILKGLTDFVTEEKARGERLETTLGTVREKLETIEPMIAALKAKAESKTDLYVQFFDPCSQKWFQVNTTTKEVVKS